MFPFTECSSTSCCMNAQIISGIFRLKRSACSFKLFMRPQMINGKYGTVLHDEPGALLCVEVNNRDSNLENFAVSPDLLSQSTTFAIFPPK